MSAGQSETYRRLSMLRGNVEDAIGNAATHKAAADQAAVASGQMAPADASPQGSRVDIPQFKGAMFPGFLLEKHLMSLPGPERPQELLRVERKARETLDFEMMLAVKEYRELCRDPKVKF